LRINSLNSLKERANHQTRVKVRKYLNQVSK